MLLTDFPVSSIVSLLNLHRREWLPQAITKFAAALSNDSHGKEEIDD
jgi:hypothetical protein